LTIFERIFRQTRWILPYQAGKACSHGLSSRLCAFRENSTQYGEKFAENRRWTAM